jgi:hypothetical protein
MWGLRMATRYGLVDAVVQHIILGAKSAVLHNLLTSILHQQGSSHWLKYSPP